MDHLVPPDQHDAFGIRINRDQSPLLAGAVPWVTILLASLAPLSPIIAPAPVLPPLAFMLLVAWRLLRPQVLPLWAGFPLGLFDDLYSGQPFGSGIMLFSLAMIALDLIDGRFPWRNFLQNWGAACALIVAYLMIAGLVSGAQLTFVQLRVLLPQILLAIILFPLVASLVALFDRLRLLRVRRLT
ncbi:rod shape-determining protein MreD [Alteraurantiacibacter buctensis]|uniref:Rod shape-determining protein MreD n=1 Tax=Alteraurantiacibacter buctensis TaxID=1503981 RepID=A0A844YUX0_9SPHN|nr:rod shape-determining protein MreD [Alteraurantiacibacter buctensis]MXO72135.1 rod shape-determining protein MreD [Alteraurantiacibacter buctensis]